MTKATLLLAWRLAIAAMAIAGTQSFAQEAMLEDIGPVSDPNNPEPGDSVGIVADYDKLSAGGPHFTAVYLTSDARKIVISFQMGFNASSTFGDCTQQIITPWAVTVYRGSEFVVSYSANYWETEDNLYPADCGFNRIVLPSTAYEVLAPGTYQIKVWWPANVSPIATSNLIVPPCLVTLPMYSARNNLVTDNFYTVSPSELQAAITLSYYTATGIKFSVVHKSSASAQFKRFYKGLPQREHFYTHLDSEVRTVVNTLGYTAEGGEGNIYPTPYAGTAKYPGTVPLYRLAQYFPANGDLQHYYTTDATELPNLEASGYTSDGIKGYVCQ